MYETDGVGPFRPGIGGAPPYLAGREAERSLFEKRFRDLQRGAALADLVVLYGPRGNGKTALLHWVEARARATSGLDTYWLTGADVPEPGALTRRLELGSWLRKLQPESVAVAGVGVSLGTLRDPPRLAEALEERARAKPLLVLLDEAHTLKPEVGQWLLNAAQTAGRHAPFLLMLAGTPDLRARLSEMGASFWSRATKLPIGRLTEDEAAEAVSRPLAAEGFDIEADALARIARESYGYPFFTQLWGRAVWQVMVDRADGADTVTTAVVEAAAAEFESHKNDYYLDRILELDRKDLLPAAKAVAAAFRDESRIELAALKELIGANTRAIERSPAEVADELQHLGFVWMTKGLPLWEPGIPSLMDYLLQNTPAPRGD